MKIKPIISHSTILFNSPQYNKPAFLSLSYIVKNEKMIISDIQSQSSAESNHSSFFFDLASQQDKKYMDLNHFNFLRMLNKGAYGKIWLASRKKTNDLYAIKIVDILQNVNLYFYHDYNLYFY